MAVRVSRLQAGRRRRIPFWMRLWLRLSVSQQDRVKSVAWSAGIHFMLIAILATIRIAAQALETNRIIQMYAADSQSEAISVEMPAAVEALEELELETLAALEPSTASSLDSLTELSPQLDALEMNHPTQEDANGNWLADVQPVSSIGDLRTDEQRIAETDRRVGAAGGTLEGPVRISLIFSGDDDIDLHVRYQSGARDVVQPSLFGMPGGQGYIFFGRPRSEHGMLDVDANAVVVVPSPCENVIFHTVPRSANYTVAIHHYASRGEIEPTPYVVVVKYGKRSKTFSGEILPKDGLKEIWKFRYSDR